MVRPKPIPKDFFGHVIEIGDRYFYGSPTVVGVVCKIKHKTIEIQLEKSPRTTSGDSTIMKCKSPDKGVCLDKIPGNGKTEYKVTWKMWRGVEPCGKADYSHHKQLFDTLEAAEECLKAKRLHNDDVKLTKITTEELKNDETTAGS